MATFEPRNARARQSKPKSGSFGTVRDGAFINRACQAGSRFPPVPLQPGTMPNDAALNPALTASTDPAILLITGFDFDCQLAVGQAQQPEVFGTTPRK